MCIRDSRHPERHHGRRGHRRHHAAGQPLGAGRHQGGGAVAQRAGQAGGTRQGRQGSVVRGPGRACHGRIIEQRLDRDQGRQGGHPAGR